MTSSKEETVACSPFVQRYLFQINNRPLKRAREENCSESKLAGVVTGLILLVFTLLLVHSQ